MFEEKVKTSRRETLVNITSMMMDALKRSGLKDGVCVVYVPHTTAGVTINENADPDVPRDIIMGLEKLIPRDWPFSHMEGNSDAHLKASLMGISVTIPIENGRPVLGTWQGVFFCEFDGPRNRRVYFHFIDTKF